MLVRTTVTGHSTSSSCDNSSCMQQPSGLQCGLHCDQGVVVPGAVLLRDAAVDLGVVDDPAGAKPAAIISAMEPSRKLRVPEHACLLSPKSKAVTSAANPKA